jgi:hypothetical protein
MPVGVGFGIEQDRFVVSHPVSKICGNARVKYSGSLADVDIPIASSLRKKARKILTFIAPRDGPNRTLGKNGFASNNGTCKRGLTPCLPRPDKLLGVSLDKILGCSLVSFGLE